MRLPNGYGTIYKLSGNRRRPWVVKKSIEGKQKALGYFVTQAEALSFLVGINRLTPEREVTFSAVYSAWSQRHFTTISKSSVSAYQISYKHLSSLHSMPFRKITYSNKILDILAERKAEDCIFPCEKYDTFRRLFDRVMKTLGMHHTPHECRHTLATMLDRSGANDTAVKMILGHARTGVTQGVYTHKTLADLRKAINKV